MATLLFFAFLAGLVTIFAPCIWPILPIVLSASVAGGRWRPLGIALGIAASFSFFTLALSSLVRIIPFDPDGLRFVAVGVIGVLGLALAVPAFSRVLEGMVSRFSSRFASPANGTREGFGGGFLVGFSLGIVWSPCAGPILAAVATFAATRAVSVEVVALTISFAIGVALPLFILASFGSKAFSKSRILNRFTGRIQQGFGVIMILAAIAIYAGYDRTLQTKLLDIFPSYGSFLTSFEESDTVTRGLAQLKGDTSRVLEKNTKDISTESGSSLPILGRAPEIVSAGSWLNTDGKSLSLESLRGKVVLVDFWTYSCINCIRTLPHVTDWYDTYHDQGFVVIGVHTPEFEFEKKTSNVLDAIQKYHIKYPVVQDNDYATWQAYANHYWPAHYLIDAEGNIREKHFGEGKYDETEAAIRELLSESGNMVSNDVVSSDMPDETPSIPLTPETYVGLARMERFDSPERATEGTTNYTIPDSLDRHHFAYGGQWTLDNENGTAGAGASLELHFSAGKVFLVLGPPSAGSGTVRVLLDGASIPEGAAGADVKGGVVTVDISRLYELVNLRGSSGDHMLRLDFETPGTSAYAFTFGE